MDEEYIMRKIRELQPDGNHVPRGVLYTRVKSVVQTDLSKILNRLLKEGRLTYRKTLNDILINTSDGEF